ncbi:ferric reductase like transmembrane component domain-containing protein [Trichoderma afarasin]
MLYAGILWIAIGSILLCWTLHRIYNLPSHIPPKPLTTIEPASARLRRTVGSAIRHFLLRDSIRSIFGHTTRLQVIVLLSLIGYLIIWTFVGLTYRTWVTPVENLPGVYNTRTTLGPWSDRIGVLAYALTPLSVMLANRESVLSLLTGVPYQSFSFLHRWLGYVIFVQSALHTIGWCVIEIRLYQPQPLVAQQWVVETYLVWGIVAMTILTLLVGLSTTWGIRLTGYEAFRKLHYSLAMLKCFMLPSLIFWLIDRGCRLMRTGLLHYHILNSGHVGFRTCTADITLFADPEYGDVYRLDIANNQDPWAIGQHYYLCFPESSIWQSHPFTPLNAPRVETGRVKHSYIIRAKHGDTKRIAQLCASKSSPAVYPDIKTTPVILTGPYGSHTMDNIEPHSNVLCVAGGGTGITYVLPILLQRVHNLRPEIRYLKWVKTELKVLQQAPEDMNLDINIFSKGKELHPTDIHVKDATSVETSGATNGGARSLCIHQNVTKLIGDFLESTIDRPTIVFSSGPGAMINDVRGVVAGFNSPSRVWCGQQRYDLKFVGEDRMEI